MMSELLSNVGNFFGSPGGKGLTSLAEIGATGAGLIGNISAERQRQQELDKLKKSEAALADPNALAAQVRSATQPLNAGLVQSIENQVSGTLAEQGLSEAPGIQATAVSQALAPFQQQNQATALQLVLTRLGLPIELAKTILAGLPSNVNLAPLLALLQKGTGTSAPATPNPPDVKSLLNLFSQNQPTAAPDFGLPDWLTNLPATSDLGTPSFTNTGVAT
jgi:hypothetical protein